MSVRFTTSAPTTWSWSPDGSRIAYSAGHLGDTVYEKAASGLGDAKVLFSKPGLPFPANVGVVSTPQSSPDGQRFLVEVTQDRRAPRTTISVVLNWPALLKP